MKSYQLVKSKTVIEGQFKSSVCFSGGQKLAKETTGARCSEARQSDEQRQTRYTQVHVS